MILNKQDVLKSLMEREKTCWDKIKILMVHKDAEKVMNTCIEIQIIQKVISEVLSMK